MHRSSVLHVVFLGLLCMVPTLGMTESYPSRPIKIIVPAAAGGVLDVNARKIADKLSRSVGQPVVVDNRPGATGNIGAEVAAKAPPDGYTLFVGNTSVNCTNPFVFSNLSYDAARDFMPVTMGTMGSPVLLVNTQLPVQTLGEFIGYAKTHPGKLLYASTGTGSSTHLGMEMLQQLAGIELIHVPYKATHQVLTDLIAGEVQTTLEYIQGAMGPIKAGKVRPIVVAGPHAKPILPGVPTADKAGLPGFGFIAWHGYFVPTGTPASVVEKLNRELRAALTAPDYVEWANSMGSEVGANSSEDFARFIQQDRERWRDVVKRSGVKLD